MKLKSSLYRKDIQVLRGMALIAILTFHANEKYFHSGYLGVDVFFVISGFVVAPLIFNIFERRKIIGFYASVKEFYSRRFLRLAPALSTTMIFSAFFLFFLMDTVQHKLLARQGISAFLLVGNLGAARYSSDYFNSPINPLIHTWSLSVEQQIYLALPILILMISKIFHQVDNFLKIFVIFTCLSFICFLFPSLMVTLYSEISFITDPELFHFYSPVERLWQFNLGGILALVGRSDTNEMGGSFYNRFARVILVVFLLVCLFNSPTVSTKMASIIVVILTLLVIKFQSVSVIPNGISSIFVWLGNRSYSIYLLHMPLLVIAIHSPILELSNSDNRNLQVVLALILSVLFGSLNFRYVENKYRLRSDYTLTNPVTFWHIFNFVFVPIFIYSIISLGQTLNLFKDPNLPNLPKRVSYEWDKNCRVMKRETVDDNKPCVYYLNESGKSILVIGDSHAASISKTLIGIGHAKGYSVSVYTHSSCPFVLDKRGLPISDSCIAHNKRILDYIKKNDPALIIYTHASSIIYVDSSQLLLRNELNSQISNDLVKILNLNSEFIFLGITPEYLPVLTVAELISGRQGRFSDTSYLDNRYWKVTAENKGYPYINIYSAFCDSTKCKNKIGDIWMFDDKSHISQSGGQYIRGILSKSLEYLD